MVIQNPGVGLTATNLPPRTVEKNGTGGQIRRSKPNSRLLDNPPVGGYLAIKMHTCTHALVGGIRRQPHQRRRRRRVIH